MKGCLKLLCAALLGIAVVPVQAQSSAPVRIVVTFAAGGGTDLYARLLASEMTKRGTPVIVENRPGASGVIAASHVAQARPDGKTVLFSSLSTLVSNTVFIDKLPYDPVKDFRAVSQIGYQPAIVVARPDAPYQDIREMVAYGKANPGKITRGSPGAAILTNLAPVSFEAMAGFTTTHVPFNGDSPGLIALAGGQIDIVGTSITGPLQYIRNGRMRVLGVMGDKRLPQVPDAKTFKEQGYDIEGLLWYGLSAPAQTPKDVIDALNKAINDVLSDPDFVARAQAMGIEAKGGSADAYDAYVRAEAERWLPQLRKLRQEQPTQ